MYMRVLKMMFLFATYSTLGASGDYVAEWLAGAPEPTGRAVVRAAPKGVEDARVDVRHGDRCTYEVERRVSVQASAAMTLRLNAGAGQLRVEGKEGLSEIRAVGKACASDRDALGRLQVSAQRSGNTVVLDTHYPDFRDFGFGGDHVARIDLIVEIPMGMAADIEDSSGSMDVSGTGDLIVEDGSGSMSVHDIRGGVKIEDGSGEIDVSQVTGSLDIQDGSGGISVRDVRGRVTLGDGSGGIDVTGAGADVVVEHDGSGSISARDVRGDFSVLHDGSGSVHWANVDGTVDVPRDKRSHRR